MRKYMISVLVVALCCVGQVSAAKVMRKPDRTPIRSVIYIVSDGAGLAHLSMLRLADSVATSHYFDEADNVLLLKTPSENNRVTDSAAAATALVTGHKTANGMLSVTPDSLPLTSIMTRAQARGIPTGIVVTSYLQHATPAALYANVASRSQTRLITEALVASGVGVAYGGGAAFVTEAQREAFERGGYAVVGDFGELARVDDAQRVVGFFAPKHLPNADAGRGEYLARGVEDALRRLDRQSNGEGFFLFVEGSLIDFASHKNDEEWLLAEMRDFDRAVKRAIEYVRSHEGVLLVVTSDHETGGVTLPSGETDFLSSDKGVEVRFSTHGHTAVSVPAFLYGTGAERFNGVMQNSAFGAELIEQFVNRR